MRIKQGIASAADQAWLSLLSFIVSYVFIRFASKEDYGTYILLLTPLYLVLGIQNSLILSPATTVVPCYPKENQAVVLATSKSLIFFFSLLGSLIAAGVLTIYLIQAKIEFNFLLILAFAIAVVGLCGREGSRSLFYITANPFAALWADLRYGVLLLIAIFLLSITSNLTPASALLSTGFAALVPFVLRQSLKLKLNIDRNVANEMWKCGRWAVVGAIVGWINTSAYPLIVASTLNINAIADITAARLFLMPIGLSITAWSNLNRPVVSTWAAEGRIKEIKVFSLRWIVTSVVSIGLLAIIITALRPYLPLVLGQSYSNIFPIILLWTVFFAVNACRTILMASLLVNAEGYKKLQAMNWVSLIISMVGLLTLSEHGAVWTVGVLIAVELTQFVQIATKVSKFWKVASV